MAKSSSGESKAPLIIALVFFVLTTIGLGVMYYMSLDEMKKTNEAAKKDRDESNTAKKLLATEKERVLVYKVAMGVNTAEELETLKNATNEAEARATHGAIVSAVNEKSTGVPHLINEAAKEFVGSGGNFTMSPDDVFKWTWAEGAKLSGGPERPMMAAVVNSYAKQQLAGLKQITNEKSTKELKSTLDAMTDRATKAEAAFKAAAANYPKQVADLKTATDTEIQKVAQDFKNNIDVHNKKAANQFEQIQQKDIELQDKQAKIAGLSIQVQRAENEKAAKEDPFSFDKPHGKVLLRHRTGNLVDINLGSADNVRTGLTFTVQPQDTPQRGLQSRARPRIAPDGRQVFENDRPVIDIFPKGTIEVVEVLGPNLSQARITSNPDPIRDAILAGDVLYNAAWRKGGADHVALFGLFDVNADGSDDIKQVIRELSKMGIIVDAYYDLETKKWVGKVTELTAYAIEGYYPTSSVGSDALGAAKSALDQALRDAKNQAKEKGVAVVKARTFFGRIGYPFRTDITVDAINRAYTRYLQTTPIDAGEPK